MMKGNASSRSGRRWSWRARIFVLALACPVLAWVAWVAAPRFTPVPEALIAESAPAWLVLDLQGRPLAHPLDGEGARRSGPLDPAEIPADLRAALLAAEDRRFDRHDGFDGLAAVRAAFQALGSGRAVSGASTITQQLVKMRLHRGEPRTGMLKIREIFLARALERRMEKDEILALYLDEADFGGIHRGVRQAALAWTSKPLGDLSLAECAMLAALPQAPGRLDPRRNPEALRKRRDMILRHLAATGMAQAPDIERALSEPLPVQRAGAPFAAPHAVAWLLSTNPDPDQFPVRTTLDLDIQENALRILRLHLDRLHGRDVGQGAVLVLENSDGAIRAWVGSADFSGPSGQVDHTRAMRSPGSAIKPFTYLAAFESGYEAWSLLADVPTALPAPDGIFEPRNFDRSFRGPVTAREALGSSLNVPSVRLLNDLGGPVALIEILRRAGLEFDPGAAQRHGVGLTLGNGETTLADLASAYLVLARGGRFARPHLIADAQAHPSGQAFDPAAAWLVGDILRDEHARRPGFGADSTLRLPFPCAVKTGTSTDFRDNWCVGFTNRFTVAVWVGNSDNRPMRGVSGLDGAAPVFRELMIWLHRQTPAQTPPPPSGLVQTEIDPLTGARALPGHPRRRSEWTRAGHLPPPAEGDGSRIRPIPLPAEFADWIVSEHNRRAELFVAAPGTDVPRVLFPSPGMRFILDPALPDNGRRLQLRTQPDHGWQWSSPSLEIEHFRGTSTAMLVPGTHTLSADHPASGMRVDIEIRVTAR